MKKDDPESAELALEGELARVASDDGASTSRGVRYVGLRRTKIRE